MKTLRTMTLLGAALLLAACNIRPGRLRVVRSEILKAESLHTFPEISSTKEEGLTSVKLDPDYKKIIGSTFLEFLHQQFQFFLSCSDS